MIFFYFWSLNSNNCHHLVLFQILSFSCFPFADKRVTFSFFLFSFFICSIVQGWRSVTAFRFNHLRKNTKYQICHSTASSTLCGCKRLYCYLVTSHFSECSGNLIDVCTCCAYCRFQQISVWFVLHVSYGELIYFPFRYSINVIMYIISFFEVIKWEWTLK